MINFVSNQVSLTILVLISIFRLLGVVAPFRKAHLKLSNFAITITWIVWIFGFGVYSEVDNDTFALFDRFNKVMYELYTKFNDSNICFNENNFVLEPYVA